MGFERKSRVCPVDRHCAEWARRYMGYCLCSTKDGFSLSLGLISVLSWGVAEIPQITTNYKKKSAEGLSILFLLTWIVGDFLNLFGCMLEPATLPTQYYTAMLYTITTLVLSTQAVYYGHIYPRLKSNKRLQEAVQAGAPEWRREHSYGLDAGQVNTGERWGFSPSSPIPLPLSSPTSSEEVFFMSARSLSVSRTPTLGSFPARTPSDVERNCPREPLLSEFRSTQSAPPPKIKTMLCVVSLMTFFLSSFNDQRAESRKNMIFKSPTRGIVLKVSRQLLEAKAATGSIRETLDPESSGIGSFLGWGMAVIYLGGRLPQICLNIRRGNVEGLNPLMFVFALVGNATYVASILVSSLRWSNIRPNLPWLVDAAGCVILDTFILMQFIYYRYRSRSEDDKSADVDTRQEVSHNGQRRFSDCMKIRLFLS
ncbi:putative vacuolar amino acid transporter YPQ1 [Sesamum alatum]|uniref:Vacuolar amino acid transporter YPQ1 n=1 Tax=Sesamum alatum TaxID=300844 RepID=A0AAE1XIS7_9LAMI|nr:putative vacuolar amino acid transporter YPQ1 [Sesamum alatum]